MDAGHFTPISPNPFIVGNPVRDRTMFFGREAEFELVRRRFHTSHGGLLVFCGERRSGKTSILFQIMDRRLGPDFVPVLVDMQSMAITSEIDFLGKVAEEILLAIGAAGETITPPDFNTSSSRPAVFQEFVQRVLRELPGRKLILLFDEYELFENKIDAGVLSPDVLHILASLMEKKPVFLVFTGSQHLERRQRSYWRILGASTYKRISYLDRDDALNLIQKPVTGVVNYGPGAVEAIYRLTAGQAFYTQAVCQTLVDQLNDQQTHDATVERVMHVVNTLVANPLPQMIFLWDSLERDEKLVLSILAETLENDTDFANQQQVSRTIAKRSYPLDLDAGRIETALDKLFSEHELLLKNTASPPGYAFRMDLWRLWIRRMHSVWQVMRALGLEIRPQRRVPRRVALIGGAVVVVFAIGGLIEFLSGARQGFKGARSPRGAPALDRGWLAFDVEPANAAIRLNGKQIAVGRFSDSLEARDHAFAVSAPDYHDSAFVVTADPVQALELHVALRPRLGSLRIQTDPAGADVRVDGVVRGKSPLQVEGLQAPVPHRIEAALAGFGASAVEAQRVIPDSTTVVRLQLSRATQTNIVVTSEPVDAALSVDGTARGRTPLTLPPLAHGKHTFAFRKSGHVPLDLDVVVDGGTTHVRADLQLEPPGILRVRGSQPGSIFVDGVLRRPNVPNSGDLTLAAGRYDVMVVVSASGDTIRESVEVLPGQRVEFDFSERRVIRQE